jgi:hypothetical protein
MKLTWENRSTREKTYHSATLSTTWTDPRSNPGLRRERPATNRLSHGTAFEVVTNNKADTGTREVEATVAPVTFVFARDTLTRSWKE